MRIAMLAWDVEGNAGSTPVGIHVALLARHLSQQGHHVDLFCPPLLDGDALLVSKTPNLSIIPVPIPKSSTDFLADNAQFCSTLQDICDAHADGNSYDIIHVHDWLPCRAAVALRQQWATPLVLTLHSTEPARVGTPELNSDQQQIAEIERQSCTAANRIISVSHSLQREIAQTYDVPEWKSEVIYNGVSLEAYHTPLDPGHIKARYQISPIAPFALFVGPLEFRMGPDLLVEAFAEARNLDPDLHLVLVGDGVLRSDLEKRANELGISSVIRFVDPLPYEELNALIRCADFICQPSRYDPFSTVVLEAWGAGKPVVATQNGGPGEYLWHDVNGVHVHATTDSVAWGMHHLMEDGDRARWLGENGRTAAATAFTWDRAATHTAEVYAHASTGGKST